VSLYVAYCQKI